MNAEERYSLSFLEAHGWDADGVGEFRADYIKPFSALLSYGFIKWNDKHETVYLTRAGIDALYDTDEPDPLQLVYRACARKEKPSD